ncbi:20298_t:CDS:2, partial [Gigaspora margarita]
DNYDDALNYRHYLSGVGCEQDIDNGYKKIGPEVCRIGLKENLAIQNKQKIQEIFQFNGKELEQFNAIARPKN